MARLCGMPAWVSSGFSGFLLLVYAKLPLGVHECVFLPCAQCFRDTLQIHRDPLQEKALKTNERINIFSQHKQVAIVTLQRSS